MSRFVLSRSLAALVGAAALATMVWSLYGLDFAGPGQLWQRAGFIAAALAVLLVGLLIVRLLSVHERLRRCLRRHSTDALTGLLTHAALVDAAAVAMPSTALLAA